ncbi:hypothetical protein [Mitsuokella multacida]|uniref:hypothetical protein n=1 Tax=Mitsuokella multacida TaxID=52226 RepID=UPI0022E83A7B|nr:hypothetical protein [Mitsuokella multacida]
MQPEKLHDALEKQQYQRETRAEAQLYNTIGLTDIPAHASIALFTFDGENPALLMGNSRFWTHSSEIGIRDQEQVNHCLRVPNHPFRVRFLNLMKRVDISYAWMRFDAVPLYLRNPGKYLVFVEQLDETYVEEVQQSLRDSFHTHHVSVTLGAIVSMTPIPDMDAIITKADREMYKDKGKKKR